MKPHTVAPTPPDGGHNAIMTRSPAAPGAPTSPAGVPPAGTSDAPHSRIDRVAGRLRTILPGLSRPLPRGRVAVVRLYGPIGGAGRTTELVELVRRLRESRRVPAVVIDIDSPGGSATASDELFLAFERLAVRKPVVVSVRGTCASGAYWAALAAKSIVANPNAIIGSIGVISAGPRFPQLLERAGVSVSVTKAGRLKDAGAPWRDDTEEERAKEQELVDAIYQAFVDRVVAGRAMAEDRVRELATGEVWLARRAQELGLVDEIGDLERAIEIAAELAGVPAKGAPVRIRRPGLARLVERFARSTSAALLDEVEARLWERYRT